MSTIAVVGVTGTIGGRVARHLTERGHDVVGLARNPRPGLPGRSRAVDLRSAAAADAALGGVDGVYVTPPLGGEDPLAHEQAVVRSVIAAAARAGVAHVVMHTAVQADRGDTGVRILDNKTPLEAALAESGVPYSILRPAWYLQNLFGAKAWLDQGMFSMPWPADMTWAATDVEDVAAAAVALFESGPANRGFDVHLPGGITGQAVVDAIAAVTDRTVAYQQFPGSTRDAVDPYPITDVHKELYAELFDHFVETTYLGEPLEITSAIPGFRYGTIEDFVARELYADEAEPADHGAGSGRAS